MGTREGLPRFDLEERTYQFARQVRLFVRTLPRSLCNREDARQLVRSSGSIGANYIEANETVGSRDFRFRLRIAKKEAKEARYWLRLVDTRGQHEFEVERDRPIQESLELMLIMNAILRKSTD